jgi:hypothetical protein
MSRHRAHSGTCDHILLSVWRLLSCLCGAPSLTRGRVCHLSFSVYSNLSVFTSSIYVTCVLQFSNLCTIYTSLFQSRIGTADMINNPRHHLHVTKQPQTYVKTKSCRPVLISPPVEMSRCVQGQCDSGIEFANIHTTVSATGQQLTDDSVDINAGHCYLEATKTECY